MVSHQQADASPTWDVFHASPTWDVFPPPSDGLDSVAATEATTPIGTPLSQHKSASDPNLIGSFLQARSISTMQGSYFFLTDNSLQPLSVGNHCQLNHYGSIPKPVTLEQKSIGYNADIPKPNKEDLYPEAQLEEDDGAQKGQKVFSFQFVVVCALLVTFTREVAMTSQATGGPEDLPTRSIIWREFPFQELNSREYKSMLNVSRFQGVSPCAAYPEALRTVERDLAILASMTGASSSGAFSLKNGMPRMVEMYDTPGSCKLNENGWVFRLRQKQGRSNYQGTLKVRSGDRYFSSYRHRTMDECCEACTDLGGKFEEDVGLGWTSKFSYSHNCEIPGGRRIANLGDIVRTWDGVADVFSDLGWSNSDPLELVSDLTVTECVYKGFEVNFDNGGKDEVGEFAVTLWYDGPDSSNPAVAEVSFSLGTSGLNLEGWNRETIMTAHSFWEDVAFLSLLDPNSDTKTAWVYNYNRTWCD